MRIANLILPVVLGAVAVPASADTIGLPGDAFALRWTALPTGAFVAASPTSAPVGVFASHVVAPDDRVDRLVDAAFASVGDDGLRRGLALYEMTTNLDQAQKTAFEPIRQAYERYAVAAGGNDATRLGQLAALVTNVGGKTTGRSVAVASGDTEAKMERAFAAALRSRTGPARSQLRASQTEWLAYRKAVMEFAESRGPADVRSISADLTIRRIAELSESPF